LISCHCNIVDKLGDTRWTGKIATQEGPLSTLEVLTLSERHSGPMLVRSSPDRTVRVQALDGDIRGGEWQM